MLKFFLFLLGLILCGIGVLAGGCSIAFTPALFQGGEFGGSGILPIWGTGLIVGGLFLWGGITVFRTINRSGTTPPPTKPDDKGPPEWR